MTNESLVQTADTDSAVNIFQRPDFTGRSRNCIDS